MERKPLQGQSARDVKLQLDIVTKELALVRDSELQALQHAYNAAEEANNLRSERNTLGVIATAAVTVATAAVMMHRRNARALVALQSTLQRAQNAAANELHMAKRFAAEPLARSLITVADNMEALHASARSLADASPSSQSTLIASLMEGASLTDASLQNALASHHVKRVCPACGDAFDPNQMEAMYPVREPKAKPGTVHTILRAGYLLHGERVLRAAQVGVVVASSQTN